MTDAQISCSHGIGIKAGLGFYGLILQPLTKATKEGRILYPIHPPQNGNPLYISNRIHIDHFSSPFALKLFVPGPQFSIVHSKIDGERIEKEPLTRGEIASNVVGQYKNWLTNGLQKLDHIPGHLKELQIVIPNPSRPQNSKNTDARLSSKFIYLIESISNVSDFIKQIMEFRLNIFEQCQSYAFRNIYLEIKYLDCFLEDYANKHLPALLEIYQFYAKNFSAPQYTFFHKHKAEFIDASKKIKAAIDAYKISEDILNQLLSPIVTIYSKDRLPPSPKFSQIENELNKLIQLVRDNTDRELKDYKDIPLFEEVIFKNLLMDS